MSANYGSLLLESLLALQPVLIVVAVLLLAVIVDLIFKKKNLQAPIFVAGVLIALGSLVTSKLIGFSAFSGMITYTHLSLLGRL